MKVFEFVNNHENCIYVVVANDKYLAIQKILDYVTKEVSKETTIDNVQENSKNIISLDYELNICKVNVYDVDTYIGMY